MFYINALVCHDSFSCVLPLRCSIPGFTWPPCLTLSHSVCPSHPLTLTHSPLTLLNNPPLPLFSLSRAPSLPHLPCLVLLRQERFLTAWLPGPDETRGICLRDLNCSDNDITAIWQRLCPDQNRVSLAAIVALLSPDPLARETVPHSVHASVYIVSVRLSSCVCVYCLGSCTWRVLLPVPSALSVAFSSKSCRCA